MGIPASIPSLQAVARGEDLRAVLAMSSVLVQLWAAGDFDVTRWIGKCFVKVTSAAR